MNEDEQKDPKCPFEVKYNTASSKFVVTDKGPGDGRMPKVSEYTDFDVVLDKHCAQTDVHNSVRRRRAAIYLTDQSDDIHS